MRSLDPVTFSILLGRLEQIADEMDATLYRSAFNPIIAEARDACHGLYHAETGATLVQGQIPPFLVAQPSGTQYLNGTCSIVAHGRRGSG